MDPNNKLRIRKADVNNAVQDKPGTVPKASTEIKPTAPKAAPAPAPVPTPSTAKSIPTPAPTRPQTIPKDPVKTQSKSVPQLPSDQTTKKDDKSVKSPVRSPSPHPLRNDEIEYDERFSDEEEDEDEEEEEEEDEDSVIDKEHWVIGNNKSSAKINSKDFLKQEIQNQNKVDTRTPKR